jgi:hypothetical protein
MGVMSLNERIVEDSHLGFSKGVPMEDGKFWIRDNANYREGTGNFSLVIKHRGEEIVVGCGHEDPTTGEWRCTVSAPYNPETDSDAIFVGQSGSRFLAKTILWKARERAYF